MPELPTFNAKQNVQTGNRVPQRENDPLRKEAGQASEDMQNITDTVAVIGQKFSDANDVMQYTQFKADTGSAIARTKAAAEADPNQDNVNAHLESLAEIMKNSSQTFSNQMVQQKAISELDNDLVVAGIEIQGQFKKKQMLTTELKLEETARMYATQKSQALTAEMAAKTDRDMMELIQANVATGVITQARGRKLLDDYRLGAVDLDIMNDNAIEKDNSYVYSQLKAGKDGIYHDLSDAERAERLEKTELHIRRNKLMNDFAVTQNQDQTEKDLLLQFGTNNVTQTKVHDLLVGTGIRPGFGEKYIKSFYEVPAEVTDHGAYNKIKMAQLNGKKQKELNNLVIENITKLTPGDKDALVNASYNALDSRTITVKASAEALTRWAVESLPGADHEARANEVMFNFFQRLDKDQNANPDEVMQGVQKDYVKKYYPSTTALPDVPNLIGNRNKIISVYKKESKMGGQKAEKKPTSTVYQNLDMDFDNL